MFFIRIADAPSLHRFVAFIESEELNLNKPALPFDPRTMDIICKREIIDGETRLLFNIPQTVIHHSPDGFEWGYGGSGPADFALNILQLFVPDDGREPIKCFNGECSQFAWRHHQDFKREFISTLDRDGGVIEGDDIRYWIAARNNNGR
jgi:hypothetical protein